jgi:hypothetical protein
VRIRLTPFLADSSVNASEGGTVSLNSEKGFLSLCRVHRLCSHSPQADPYASPMSYGSENPPLKSVDKYSMRKSAWHRGAHVARGQLQSRRL